MTDLRFVEGSGELDPQWAEDHGVWAGFDREWYPNNGIGGKCGDDPLLVHVAVAAMTDPDYDSHDAPPYFSFSIADLVTTMLEGNQDLDGQLHLVDDQVQPWLAVADALEAQAKRIREQVAVAKLETREEYDRSIAAWSKPHADNA